MTSVDKSGFTVSAVGTQVQSQRESVACHKISRVGRDQVEAVYISEDHTKTARIGREGQGLGGAKGTMGGLSFGFGTARRDITTLQRTSTTRSKPGEFFAPTIEDIDDIPTNDALDVIPDGQKFKYVRDPTMVIGTEPRGKLKDAELMHNHAVAFYARSSPGPAAIGGEFGPQYLSTKPRMAMARPFGARTKNKALDFTAPQGESPPEVGPGRHDRRDVSIGPQYLTHRRNQSCHEFPQAQRFKREKNEDAISQLDVARSCMGKQTLARNRSAPSVGFSVDSRDTRSKTKLCMTRSDEGPRAMMPKFVARQPALPSERHLMRSGFG
mmetsp:Transcript_98947/g.284273  ORF Transcript_98947/g.284273 Transcript_98947/m.284273 type:complete len:326 (+) Transcript_98947:131-1108(+)